MNRIDTKDPRLTEALITIADQNYEILDLREKLSRARLRSGAALLAAFAGGFIAVFVMKWSGL